jgi:hypothetical protein
MLKLLRTDAYSMKYNIFVSCNQKSFCKKNKSEDVNVIRAKKESDEDFHENDDDAKTESINI